MSQEVSFAANELINIIELTFNRPIRPEGLGLTGTPQSILVVGPDVSPTVGQARLFGDLDLHQPNVVRFYLRQPFTGPPPDDQPRHHEPGGAV
jgi:hypothetical protein